MSLDTPFVRGAARLQRRIQTIRANLALPALVEATGAILLRRTRERFDREIDPNYIPWVPLADATLAIKRRLGYAGKGKLKRTENLREAIDVIRGGSGTLSALTGAGVRIGVQDQEIAKYGRFQQRGTAKIPIRRFLGIGRLDIRSVDGLMRRTARRLENL